MPKRSEIDRHVAQRVRDIRIARGLTQPQLGELSGLSTDSVAKLEASRRDHPPNRRSASIRDLLALALALNVSPLDLLLPAKETAEVEVAPGQTFGAIWVRDWIAGLGPIDVAGSADEDRVRAYFAFAPEWVRRRHAAWRHPATLAIRELETYVRDAVAGSDVDPDLMADAIRRASRSVSRQAETLAAELEDQLPAGAHPGISAPRRDDRRQP